MYTTSATILHQKALWALDAIDRLTKRITDAKNDLISWDRAGHFDPIRLMRSRKDIEEIMAWWWQMRARVALYYRNIMRKLIDLSIRCNIKQDAA